VLLFVLILFLLAMDIPVFFFMYQEYKRLGILCKELVFFLTFLLITADGLMAIVVLKM
jgi:hypothetical protein